MMNDGLQVRGALRELRDSFGQLLGGRRAGVVATLLAAAARSGNAALQLDAAKALLAATAALQSGTQAQVHSARIDGERCSALAALMLLQCCTVTVTEKSHRSCAPRMQL